MICHRLLSIALRKYTAEPETRPPAVRMILLNAIRLCIAHLGRDETSKLALQALNEQRKSAA